MKLKKTYRIDGENWELVRDKKLMSDASSYGKANFVRKQIIIDPTSNRTPITLLHEAIHVIGDNAELELKEQSVKRLSHGIYAFIRDNKVNLLED